MKRKALVALTLFAIAALLLGAGIWYAAGVMLPVKLRAFLIDRLRASTGREVTLDSVSFNPFKGLVVRGLSVHDRQGRTLFSVEEARAVVLIQPFFRKQVIVPSVTCRNAFISIHRRQDGTWNVSDLLQRTSGVSSFPYQVVVRRVVCTASSLEFIDDSTAVPLRARVSGISAAASGALTGIGSVTFQGMVSEPFASKCMGKGQFDLKAGQYALDVSLERVDLAACAGYFLPLRVKSLGGSVSVKGKGVFSAGEWFLEGEAQGKGLSCAGASWEAEGAAGVKVQAVQGKESWKFSGSASVQEAYVRGIPGIGQVAKADAQFLFDRAGVRSTSLQAQVWDLPAQGSLIWTPGAERVLQIQASSKVPFALLEASAQKYFDYRVPSRLKDDGTVETAFSFADGDMRLTVASKSLRAAAALRVQDSEVLIGQCAGNWYRSKFDLSGKVIPSRPEEPSRGARCQLRGTVTFDLEDAVKWFPAQSQVITRAAPSGKVEATVAVSGPLSVPASWTVVADTVSPEVSLYGLKLSQISARYAQDKGIGGVNNFSAVLYEGAVRVSARMNLGSGRMPYWATVDVSGVKLEKLKLDTAARDKDIAGSVRMQAKLTGFISDADSVSGSGKLAIEKGKLWELDLFKGMGKLIFSRDFAHIVFKEGHCNFTLRDQSISTHQCFLQSDIARLSGPVRIGFDGSLYARLGVSVLDEMVPLTNTFKDITTSIAGQATKVGVIRLGGTLAKPSHTFELAGVDMLKGIKDFIFSK